MDKALEEGYGEDTSLLAMKCDNEPRDDDIFRNERLYSKAEPMAKHIRDCPGQENLYKILRDNGRHVDARVTESLSGYHFALLGPFVLLFSGVIIYTTWTMTFFSIGRSCGTPGFERYTFDGRNLSLPVTKLNQVYQDRAVPKFIYEYAPYVYLSSKENFWPCNIDEHLNHVTPHLNYTPIAYPPRRRTLDDLVELNKYGNDVYLTSDDDPTLRWRWLGGAMNQPEDRDPSIEDGEKDINWGRSNAKAVIIWLDKGVQELDERWAILDTQEDRLPVAELPKRKGRVVDAFYFYFYSFNLGNEVFRLRFGNHVGDWEHTMVRFVDDDPKVMFFSQHQLGVSVEYNAVQKLGKRPITYSASGTHANYPSPGIHKYALPFGILKDFTDGGSLWDPTKNAYVWKYDHINEVLYSSTDTPDAPTGWFYFKGRWGDKVLPISDPRQYGYFGQYHFASGPEGPLFKRLSRLGVCPSDDPCRISFNLKEWENGGKKPDNVADLKTYGGRLEQPLLN